MSWCTNIKRCYFGKKITLLLDNLIKFYVILNVFNIFGIHKVYYKIIFLNFCMK